MTDESLAERCVCGHALDTHQHFRPGDDCGECGPEACSSFRAVGPAGLLGRLRALLSPGRKN